MDPQEQSAAQATPTAPPQTIVSASGGYGRGPTVGPPPTEADVCRLYELTDDDNKGHRNVFVLGTLSSRSERIAVISQQTRAVNLIHCLFASGRWSAGQRVCVIGGGAAGLTAAAYAIHKGAQVTVLEWNDLLWNLRGCRTRWLHPNLFRHWPDPRWKCVGTHLPVMNWYAGYASEVGELLLSKYRSFEASQAARKNLSIQYPGHQTARDTRIEPQGDYWKVSWCLPAEVSKHRNEDEFDAVIIATGFGSEARLRDTEASVYWLDDVLERERPEPRERRYLISGTGDGGLTDLLRIRIKGFRHHHLREWLLHLEFSHRDLQAAIQQIEQQARASEHYDPTDEYLRLATECRFGPLLEHLRAENSVMLTHREQGKALVCPAWSISRFLAAQLLQHDQPGTSFRQGPVSWCADDPQGPADAGPPAHPERFRARFDDGHTTTFDAVVTRHGPEKVLDPAFSSKRVRSSLALLRQLGFDPAAILAAEGKWADVGNTRKVTDELWVTDFENAENTLRSRAQLVLPPISGRTVIGMLSRLVANVRPEHDADRPLKSLDICYPLVSDEAAALLDPVGDRILLTKAVAGSSELEYHGGWHMGREVDRRAAIEAISAADRWFSQHPELPPLADLERNWVLPRTSWSTAKTFLKHTVVATHWGDWKLRYQVLPMPGRKLPKTPHGRRNRLQIELDSLESVREWFAQERVLGVVDVPEFEMRVGLFRAGTSRAWRLARELGVNWLYLSMGNGEAGWAEP